MEILSEAEHCTAPGELSALLRRKGLYSSHISNWRQQQKAGQFSPGAKKRGPVAVVKDPRDARIAKLERQLERAELICDLQKKVAALCGWELATLPDETPNELKSK